ncbi:MAG: acetyl-CoA C-acyltransferase, partial [Gammaproteobacteria bacterium]|nr:acetyl-CoA C-acyltransferase [Gammaproteobacteria bacterium]
MREAVIIATARTPIGKAYRGAFNNTEAPTLGGHAIRHAVERAGVYTSEIDDVIMGCAMPQGTQGKNVARQALLAAGLPVSVAGMTVDRQCSSGMMAIGIAAKAILADGMDIVVGGGFESISLVQNEHMNTYRAIDPRVVALHAHTYMAMIDTAEVVAKRYAISREAQDEYALQSQQRTAAAQAAGRFAAEIVPLAASMAVMDKETKEVSFKDVLLEQDEGNRPSTTLEGLLALKPVRDHGVITAGNASQLSDGASSAVLMEASVAAKRGIEPLGIYRGTAVAGCEPDEMGIGPVYAVPKLLRRNGLKMSDIGLWELNEAFAVQVIYCR